MQSVQLVFPLRQPELYDGWQGDPEFNARIHERLLASHRLIVESTPTSDSRPNVEQELVSLRGKAMSRRQKMLLHYLLAQCALARDLSQTAHFVKVLQRLQEAEHIALSLLDFGAQVDLHEFKGKTHRAVSMYWVAAEEYSYALRILREHSEDRASFDPDFEVTLAAKTAVMEYFLGDCERALEHIRRAEELLPLVTKSPASQGTVEWTLALLNRQRNELFDALGYAEEAAQLYRLEGATNSTCRILYLTADIALDVAESAAPVAQEVCDEYLALASQYLAEAFEVGQIAADEAGNELAKLARARLERLLGKTEAVVSEASIRAVLRQARRMRDDSLLTAAQTEMGAALLARRQTSRGKRWLKMAITTAASINAPGLAFRAQRLLRHADGRNA